MHEMAKPIFWENKKNIINLSSAELAQRMVMVKAGIGRQWVLIPSMLQVNISAGDILKFSLFFAHKIEFDISCKLCPKDVKH